MTATPPFRILTVCTGNICRSPMAERLLQLGLDKATPGAFQVSSAGTGALVGHGIEPHVAGFIRVMGGSAENFVSRQLTPAILAEQDLVIALTRAHRSKVVELQPSLLKKTFTLLELARILPNIEVPHGLGPEERWEAMVPLALRARSMYRSRQVLVGIADRMGELGLTLHPTKTAIVHCKVGKREKPYKRTSFRFLRYTFRPRTARDRKGITFLAFLPAISTHALKRIGRDVRLWRFFVVSGELSSRVSVMPSSGWHFSRE